MKSVHNNRSEPIAAWDLIDEASESIVVMAPSVDDKLLDRLFAIERPLDINLLTRSRAVKENPRPLRDHIKQLQDVNQNIDVRITGETFPANTIVDGSEMNCDSNAGARLNSERSDSTFW